MNRLIVSIVILAVMTVGSFAAVATVNSVTNDMIAAVSETEKAFEDGDSERCVEAAKRLYDLWDNFSGYSILVNDLGHAVEITSSIAEINSFAQDGNDELYAACDRAQALIDMFRDMQQPTFWKIL